MNDDPEARAASARTEATQLLATISKAMNDLYVEQLGRGAGRVRTEWAGPNTLVVTLEDTFTPAERTLVRLGEHQRLRDLRMVFQHASVPEFCEPVERLTGRKVRAFLSAIDTAVDGLSLETFVLHPSGYPGPSRAQLPR